MAKNVIILTPGLSGSSPLAGLFSQAGFWSGDSTREKHDYRGRKDRGYNTFENEALIDLNDSILATALDDSDYDYRMEFSREAIDKIAACRKSLDPAPFEQFIAQCNEHGPWMWKDPRLWLTMRVWIHWLDLDDVKFILLTREHLQLWISTTIRRQIQTFSYAKNYVEQIKASLVEFLDSNGQDYLDLCFEDLIVHPEQSLVALNDFLGTSLSIEDWKAVYSKRLYKKPLEFKDFCHALLIYIKNYRQRYR